MDKDLNASTAGDLREDAVWMRGYGETIPEVYLNDRRVWLQVLLETPNELLCRVETYAPARFLGGVVQPPTMIRAYTCDFMARVAFGLEEVCQRLQWGRVLAGPGSMSSQSTDAEEVPRDRRRVRERTGSNAGGAAVSDPVVSPNAIGVGSAAC